MRILIYGTSPLCYSGYASAVRAIARGLTTRGHDVACYAWNSWIGPPITWEGVPVLPAGYAINGRDMIAPYVNEFHADLLLTVCDPWISTPEQWQEGHDRPIVHWYPIHADPADPRLCYVVAKAKAGLCYSQWGQRVMAAEGVTNSRYVPLGVDPAIFRPLDRQACREAVFVPHMKDRFIVGCIAANASTCPFGRKAFDVLAQAFRRFQADHPEAALYLHTLPGKENGGYDLAPVFESLGLVPGEDVFFADRRAMTTHGYDDEHMTRIYNACDVMAQASLAEGFGLPILEAQSCGTPVLTHDATSMTELTAHGRAVPSCVRLWSPGAVTGWVGVPDTAALTQGLVDAHAGHFAETREAGLELARSLAWDRVLDEHLVPALEDALA